MVKPEASAAPIVIEIEYTLTIPGFLGKYFLIKLDNKGPAKLTPTPPANAVMSRIATDWLVPRSAVAIVIRRIEKNSVL